MYLPRCLCVDSIRAYRFSLTDGVPIPCSPSVRFHGGFTKKLPGFISRDQKVDGDVEIKKVALTYNAFCEEETNFKIELGQWLVRMEAFLATAFFPLVSFAQR